MNRWTGRVAIVTGASSGIGAAIATALAENGLKVVGVARRLERVQKLSEELKSKNTKGTVHAVQGDVTKEEDVIRVVKWARDNLGGADVLVNNAGIYRGNLLTDVSVSNIHDTLNTNVVGLLLFCREVIKDMRERGVNDGHIFNIGSIAGQEIVNMPEIYVYCGSKHAVRVITEGLRRELRDLGTKIKVTHISPGLVRTEIFKAAGVPSEMADTMLSENVALEPEDVAHALVYSLSTPPRVQIHEMTIHPTGERF